MQNYINIVVNVNFVILFLVCTFTSYVCTCVCIMQKVFEQERQTREKEERLILSAWYNLVSTLIMTTPSHYHSNTGSQISSTSNKREVKYAGFISNSTETSGFKEITGNWWEHSSLLINILIILTCACTFCPQYYNNYNNFQLVVQVHHSMDNSCFNLASFYGWFWVPNNIAP